MTFYVADDADPLIRAWQGVFPTLFQPLSELPADLRPHLRVPEELFDVQTRVFGRYHVTGSRDVLLPERPLDRADRDGQHPEPAARGVLRDDADAGRGGNRVPAAPADDPQGPAEHDRLGGRPERSRSATARPACSGSRADSTIFGPVQVEAQIDADPEISQQISLWDAAGSEVVRGNLIVVPVGDSLIYLQPVYLRSKSSGFPAFERIVVASPTNVVWGTSLSRRPHPAPHRAGREQAPGRRRHPARRRPRARLQRRARPRRRADRRCRPTSRRSLAYADEHFKLADEALRNSDFARYGVGDRARRGRPSPRP